MHRTTTSPARALGLWPFGCAVLGLLLAGLATAAADPPPGAGKPAGGEGLALGKPIEDFGLRELDLATGKLTGLVWLSDFVGDTGERKRPSRLLLLNFFATWCKPCVKEFPVLSRLQRDYAAHGLRVLSVNFRAESEAPDAAIAATRKLWAGTAPGFPLLFDRYTNRNQLLYMGERAVLPCNLLIDERGTLLARFQGGAESELEAIEASIRRQLGLAPTATATK